MLFAFPAAAVQKKNWSVIDDLLYIDNALFKNYCVYGITCILSPRESGLCVYHHELADYVWLWYLEVQISPQEPPDKVS